MNKNLLLSLVLLLSNAVTMNVTLAEVAGAAGIENAADTTKNYDNADNSAEEPDEDDDYDFTEEEIILE